MYADADADADAEADADADADAQVDAEGKDSAERSVERSLGLFTSLDQFVRTSSLGEFPARLHLIRAFAAQVLATTDTSASSNAERHEARQLGRVLLSLWRYYSQFLPEVRGVLAQGRGPIEAKLKQEVKVSSTDSSTSTSAAITTPTITARA